MFENILFGNILMFQNILFGNILMFTNILLSLLRDLKNNDKKLLVWKNK